MRAAMTALFALTLMTGLMAGLMPAVEAHAEDGISAGRIKMDCSANGSGYEKIFYEDLRRLSGTVGLVFYIW